MWKIYMFCSSKSKFVIWYIIYKLVNSCEFFLKMTFVSKKHTISQKRRDFWRDDWNSSWISNVKVRLTEIFTISNVARFCWTLIFFLVSILIMIFMISYTFSIFSWPKWILNSKVCFTMIISQRPLYIWAWKLHDLLKMCEVYHHANTLFCWCSNQSTI